MGNGPDKESKVIFQEQEKGTYEQMKDGFSKTCKCSIKTRLIGYVVCFSVGWLISFFSTISFLIKRDVVLFAILYSFGQILNIVGSCFLATPKTQAKDMVKKTRIWLTIAYLGSAIATIVLAFVLPAHLRGLVLITLIIQVISYFLYTLSYIPYGRKMIKKFCQCLLFQ